MDEPRTVAYFSMEIGVLPLFYHNRDGFIDIMRHTMALNGSFFNTHRMMQQYVLILSVSRTRIAMEDSASANTGPAAQAQVQLVHYGRRSPFLKKTR